ncbi:MAG: nucleotide exchange factor GrpE [Bacteroidales bacterium]
MSGKKHKEEIPHEEEKKVAANAAEQGEGQEKAAGASDETNPELELPEEGVSDQDELNKLTDRCAEMEKKYNDMHNDYLRLMADFDNFRKRTLREKADLLKNGGEGALKNLLPVIDDFERALSALESSDDINAVKEGVELIYNKFKGYLEANGVKEIPATGEDFDTEIHEAITTFPAPTPEQKGKVIDCMTKGYKLNDKVIRFAKVVVGE